MTNKNVVVDDKRQEIVIASGSQRMRTFTVVAKVDLLGIYLSKLRQGRR